MIENQAKINALCAQGDIRAVLQFIQQTKAEDPDLQVLEKRYRRRFFGSSRRLHVPSKDPWIREVMLAYYAYYIEVLAEGVGTAVADERLLGRLSLLLAEAASDIDDAESRLKTIFHEKGYRFLGGVTYPYRGPYIWKTDRTQQYIVQLPYGEQTVTVHFLHDFLMHSWLHFASFGATAAGGWATQNGLFCVFNRYKKDLDTDAFRISYLKHEGQHLMDLGAYPDMEPTDLEYRAKLVELIYYETTEQLHRFAMQARNDPNNPHSYAAYRIMKAVNAHFGDDEAPAASMNYCNIPYERISAFCRTLLDAHTRHLRDAALEPINP